MFFLIQSFAFQNKNFVLESTIQSFAFQNKVFVLENENELRSFATIPKKEYLETECTKRAGNAIRTRDILVGNEMLYRWAIPAYFFL